MLEILVKGLKHITYSIVIGICHQQLVKVQFFSPKSVVAVYNTNFSQVFKNPKLGAKHCRSYSHELFYTRFGIDQLTLQSDVGLPVVRAACSYSDRRYLNHRCTNRGHLIYPLKYFKWS